MEELATEAGKTFLTQGVLGSLCLILLGALVYVYREKGKCETARLGELERIIEAREGLAKALAANTLALEANNKASEARTRATEEIAHEVADLRQALQLAVQQNSFDQREIKGLLDELKRRGGSA